MNEADALELLRAAIWTIIMGSGPAVAAAMCVGLIIALLQALTQVQEATLTFVPRLSLFLSRLRLALPSSAAKSKRLPDICNIHRNAFDINATSKFMQSWVTHG